MTDQKRVERTNNDIELFGRLSQEARYKSYKKYTTPVTPWDEAVRLGMVCTVPEAPSSDVAYFEVDEAASREANAILDHMAEKYGESWYSGMRMRALEPRFDIVQCSWESPPDLPTTANANPWPLQVNDKVAAEIEVGIDWGHSESPVVTFELWQKPTEQHPQGVHAISHGGQKWEMIGTCENVTLDKLTVGFTPNPHMERQRLRNAVCDAAMADYVASRGHFTQPVTHTEDQCRLAVHNLMVGCAALEEFEARPMQEFRERLEAAQEAKAE